MRSTPVHPLSCIAGLLLAFATALWPGMARGQTHSGNVVSFSKDGIQGVYVFEARSAHLYARFVSGSSMGAWEDHGTPPGQNMDLNSPLSEPAVLTYSSPVGIDPAPQLAVFVVRNGALYSRQWDGSEWSWTRLGAPTRKMLSNEAPAVITYLEADLVTRRIVAFVRDTNGDLHKLSRTGSVSTWLFLGHPSGQYPAGMLLASGAGVVSTVDGGIRRIYAFVPVNNTGLWLNYYDGTNHSWVDQGGSSDNRPSAITYTDAGVRLIHAFVRQFNWDRDLWVNYWDGSAWHWADQKDVGHIVGVPHAITYQQNGYRHIFVWVAKHCFDPIGVDSCTDGTARLWVNLWDGFQWNWYNTSTAWGPQDSVVATGAATYELGDERRLVAVARETNGDVWFKTFYSGLWQWLNLGQP